ncbi:aldose 1-epimerase family protein [Asticcacaulis sp.]|uniref:aldose 1-epimerase family protein n=1 Tax=Asticcacaulis sp. TaxID=1872648 RepID=UPI002CD8BFE1|nr:aldose 1-epimerase family protein [Asticcacaulis sp.]HTM81544.1 aldose 1-epimerase family protein [Asticcacaulis sp.]
MISLFGKEYSRRALAAHTGQLSQFAGVRLMTLGDGVERGVRMLEFRTGSGLRFTVLVDRAMDIADCEHNGRAVGWHSPSGFRHPGLHDYEGESGLGWFRSFSGLMVTCGLDHILFMDEDDASQYHYSARKTVSSSLHGRIGTIPARLTGYGESWDGDECTLWAEGVVQQSTVFGEDLHLIRRIEAKVGSNEIHLHDRVVNHGFYRTPHMYCYHINVGHPILGEGSRYVAPIRDVVWAAHADDYRKQGVGYRTLSEPKLNFHEQVWQHDMQPDNADRVCVALVNDKLGFGIEIVTRKSQFPAMYEWQNLQAGHYALGIEPSTNHVFGKPFARERDELIWLEHGDERNYETQLRILPDAAAVTECTARIATVATQPEADYPVPSGSFPPIKRT